MGRNRGKKKTNHRLEALERGKQAAFEELAHSHNSNSKNNRFLQNNMNRPRPTQTHADPLGVRQRENKPQEEDLRPSSPLEPEPWVYEEEKLDSELPNDKEEIEKSDLKLAVPQEEEDTDSEFESSIVTVKIDRGEQEDIGSEFESSIVTAVLDLDQLVQEIADKGEMMEYNEEDRTPASVQALIEELGLDEAVRFLHNFYLNQFEERNYTNSALFHSQMCQLIQLGNIESVMICSEFLTNPAILYNVAAMRFYNRMYAEAYNVVERLMLYKDGTDVISLKTRLLYISILMESKHIDKTLREINNFESFLGALERAPSVKRDKSKKRKKVLYVLPENDLEISLRLSLQKKKVICLLRLKNLIEAKREYKTCVNLANSIPKEGRTPEMIYLISLQAHLKAYLEFLSGRPDKALNLLTGLAFGYDVPPPLGLWSMSTPHNQESFWSTGDNLDIILNNNAACCYIAMKKNCVASWYLKIACDACDNPELKDKSELPIQCLRFNRKYECMYNYTVSSLRSRHFYRAFYYGWVISRKAFSKHPMLWLLLAEACVNINAERAQNGVFTELGLFEPLNEFRHNCPITGELLPFPEVPPTPNITYGLQCIRNAWRLIHPDIIKQNNGIQLLPHPIKSESQIIKFRGKLLMAGAYLAWAGGYHKKVIRYGQRILNLFYVAPIYHCLSQTYWALSLEQTGQTDTALGVYSDARKEGYSFITPGMPPLVSRKNKSERSNSKDGMAPVYAVPSIYCLNKVIEVPPRPPGRKSGVLAYARHAFTYNHALALVHEKMFKSANDVLQSWLKMHGKAAAKYHKSLLSKFEYLAASVQQILAICAAAIPPELQGQKLVISKMDPEEPKVGPSQSSSSKAAAPTPVPAPSCPKGPSVPKRTAPTSAQVKANQEKKAAIRGLTKISEWKGLPDPDPPSSSTVDPAVVGSRKHKPNRKSNRARKS